VGIRADENREGYISKKPNIQSIFPFRKNIWSEDVIAKLLRNDSIPQWVSAYKKISFSRQKDALLMAGEPITQKFSRKQKLDGLLNCGVKEFNAVVFSMLREGTYPLAMADAFPLVDNEDEFVRDDIFKLLRDSGVGVPEYYEKVEFSLEGKKGAYSRSRSGCYFCFFQQRIEWVWLLEQHPELFQKAMEYEKDGYTWRQGETLAELSKPARVREIKEEYLKRTVKKSPNPRSPYLLDILEDAEEEGCVACFI
jgi:hypothetical protein